MERTNGKASPKENAIITNDLSTDFSPFYAQNDRNGQRSRTPRTNYIQGMRGAGYFTGGGTLENIA